MWLFEIVTTRIGESYVRAYAWAKGVGEARTMFEERHPGVEIRSILPLLGAGEQPFCTALSDSGWPEENVYGVTGSR